MSLSAITQTRGFIVCPHCREEIALEGEVTSPRKRVRPKGSYKMSPEGRERILKANADRWAKFRRIKEEALIQEVEKIKALRGKGDSGDE